MFETHETRDGQEMMICQMSDEHLLNTIRVYCTKIEQCVKVINGIQNIEGGKLIAVLNPKYSQENMIEQATYTIKKLDKNIQPYIMEAALRGINVTELIQKAYQRKAKIATPESILIDSSITEFNSLINDLKKLDYNPKEDY